MRRKQTIVLRTVHSLVKPHSYRFQYLEREPVSSCVQTLESERVVARFRRNRISRMEAGCEEKGGQASPAADAAPAHSCSEFTAGGDDNAPQEGESSSANMHAILSRGESTIHITQSYIAEKTNNISAVLKTQRRMGEKRRRTTTIRLSTIAFMSALTSVCLFLFASEHCLWCQPAGLCNIPVAVIICLRLLKPTYRTAVRNTSFFVGVLALCAAVGHVIAMCVGGLVRTGRPFGQHIYALHQGGSNLTRFLELSGGLPRWWIALRLFRDIAVDLVVLVGASVLLWNSMSRSRDTRRRHFTIWMTAASAFALAGTILLVVKIVEECADFVDPLQSSFLVVSIFWLLAGLVSFTKRMRNNNHEFLQRICRSWRKEENLQAASGVAALIGNLDVGDVISKSKQHYRCVRLDKVTREHMASSKPDPALYAFSEKATLGRVDAFISHSWSDDPAAKWEAISQWRENFKRSHKGREPLVWIDKFCIDQTNVTDNLACLPVYLSGCKKMVVFAGTTYTSRLWCILELFVYLQMLNSLQQDSMLASSGREITSKTSSFDRVRRATAKAAHRVSAKVAPTLTAQVDTSFSGRPGGRDLQVIPVSTGNAEQRVQQLEAIQETFEAFDVSKAQCYNQNDRSQILGIIEASFSLQGFGRCVRRMLSGQDLQSQIDSHRSSSSVEMNSSAAKSGS